MARQQNFGSRGGSRTAAQRYGGRTVCGWTWTSGGRLIGADVFGITLGLDTECPEFAEFVSRKDGAFLSDVADSPEIRVRFRQTAGDRARHRRQGMRTADMGLQIDERCPFWENEFGFANLLEPDTAHGFDVDACHFDLGHERDADLLARNLQRSMRWALHLPQSG